MLDAARERVGEASWERGASGEEDTERRASFRGGGAGEVCSSPLELHRVDFVQYTISAMVPVRMGLRKACEGLF